MMNKKFRNLLLLILFAGILFSCAPTEKARYFRHYKESPDLNSPDKIYYVDKDSSGIIQRGDQLYIQVTSGNDEPNSFNQSRNTSGVGSELMGYPVDEAGFIRLPYLKDVHVAGTTIKSLIKKLETDLTQYIYLPSVTIRKINSRIVILGEVYRPGIVVYNRNSMNIFQAIASAGEISSYGNRRNVLIVRQDGDKIIKKYIDLTNDEIFTSDWYHVQSEDIIYVEPMGRRKWGMETFSVISWLNLVSTVILTYTLLTSTNF